MYVFDVMCLCQWAVVFPQDLFGAGLLGNDTQMAMLGLGDIVVPGILVALMLRFDTRSGHARAYYFWATYVAYLAGLLTTIAVMHFFKHAQVRALPFPSLSLSSPSQYFSVLAHFHFTSICMYEMFLNTEYI